MNYTTQLSTQLDPDELKFNDKMSNTPLRKQLKQLLLMNILQHQKVIYLQK